LSKKTKKRFLLQSKKHKTAFALRLPWHFGHVRYALITLSNQGEAARFPAIIPWLSKCLLAKRGV
jgi:hypothetical protein